MWEWLCIRSIQLSRLFSRAHATWGVSLQAMADLDWKPDFDLVAGLTDSYQKDFGRGTFRKEADFSTDDQILEKVHSKEPALA